MSGSNNPMRLIVGSAIGVLLAATLLASLGLTAYGAIPFAALVLCLLLVPALLRSIGIVSRRFTLITVIAFPFVTGGLAYLLHNSVCGLLASLATSGDLASPLEEMLRGRCAAQEISATGLGTIWFMLLSVLILLVVFRSHFISSRTDVT